VTALDPEVVVEVLVERPPAMVAADEPFAELLLQAARRQPRPVSAGAGRLREVRGQPRVRDDGGRVTTTDKERTAASSGGGPPRGGPPEPPHRDARYYQLPPRKRRWPVVLGFVLWGVIAGVAALAWGAYSFVDTTLSKANDNEIVQKAARKTAPFINGEPRTILLIGTDRRPEAGKAFGNSDSMILVRIDSRQNYISMLSFARDLYVDIPGVGQGRINSAYAGGGPERALDTIANLTGQRANDFMLVDFKGFEKLVDEVGGVYIDSDRKYFNDNSGSESSYEAIDINAGYQLLNGHDALDYVRYRHTDSDFARIVRQQLFLSELKRRTNKIGNLLSAPSFLRILGNNIDTTLKPPEQLEVARIALQTPDSRINRVRIQGNTTTLQDGAQVNLVDPAEVQEKVAEWQNPEFVGGPKTKRVDPASVQVRVLNGSGRTLAAEDMATLLREKGYRAAAAGNADTFEYTTSTVRYGAGSAAAGAQVQKLIGPKTGLAPLGSSTGAGNQVVLVVGKEFVDSLYVAPPVPRTAPVVPETINTAQLAGFTRRARKYLGPKLRVPLKLATGSSLKIYRPYRISASGDDPWAIKMVFQLPQAGGIYGYWGIMATEMKNPPILRGGLTLPNGHLTFYDGKTLLREAWQKDGIWYWISNTLDKDRRLNPETMHAIANSFVPVAKARLPKNTKATTITLEIDAYTP
jgi:LCP family protein required for cell wall assembly